VDEVTKPERSATLFPGDAFVEDFFDQTEVYGGWVVAVELSISHDFIKHKIDRSFPLEDVRAGDGIFDASSATLCFGRI
jgi:hypothetical protein